MTKIEKSEKYNTLPVEYIQTATAKVAYRKSGSGPAIIFLHGWPLSGATFRKLMPLLENDYTCYFIDLPGGGLTEWGNHTDFTWPGQAATVKEFVDKIGIDSYYLVGQNSGAMIGRCLALADSRRIKKFIMTNTEIPGHRPPWMRLYRMLMFLPGANYILRMTLLSKLFLKSPMGFGGAFINRDLIFSDFYHLIIEPLIKNHRSMAGHNRFLRGWNWSLLDSMATKHKDITMPVLFLWGEGDKTFPLHLAKEMLEQFPQAAQIQTTAKAKVFIQEEDPEFMAGEIKGFFK